MFIFDRDARRGHRETDDQREYGDSDAQGVSP
jgi:hypothetical protein